jgi:putative membrane protein
MINRFQDHAANERTFLSWIRTAVTIAGFGIVIEKLPMTNEPAWFGASLIGLSGLLVLFSTIRFLVIRHQLGKPSSDQTSFGLIETLFALMLAMLLAIVFVFLVRTLV